MAKAASKGAATEKNGRVVTIRILIGLLHVGEFKGLGMTDTPRKTEPDDTQAQRGRFSMEPVGPPNATLLVLLVPQV